MYLPKFSSLSRNSLRIHNRSPLVLLSQRDSGTHTTVDEKEVTANEERFKVLQKPQMIGRHDLHELFDQMGLVSRVWIEHRPKAVNVRRQMIWD
jgi:hypothetical protein